MENGGAKLFHLAEDLPQGSDHPDIVLIGESTLFRQILAVVDAVAGNDSVVLLEGESGTGKELLARRIHARSARSTRPFIPANCPAISETLFESQFYGHVRGAFTNASTDTLGIVRAAEGGTLLLDEVGELPLHLQPKLLRLIQEREVNPVGAPRPVAVNVRFIASTNCCLARCVAEGTFRSDLYHRLNIVRIEVPPLRTRPEDVDPLLDYYLQYFAHQYGKSVCLLGSHIRKCLHEYPWPGNVRELCAYVERLYAANLPPMPPSPAPLHGEYISHAQPLEPAEGRMGLTDHTPVCHTLAEAQIRAIHNALVAARYNRSEAAKLLAIHRSTLLRKIRLYGLDRRE